MLANPEDTPQARHRKMYYRGSTTIFSCRKDPRFAYCLYVPQSFDESPDNHQLLVAVHGTGRTMVEYRDAFAEFGRFNRYIILAPLFPVGPLGDGNPHGFKYLKEGDIRYDEVLLAMVDEVAQTLSTTFDRFSLFGYSGGGHFANRFYYLHPERLRSVSIGAPGSVTLLDDSREWWVGTGGIEAVFGKSLDLAALREVDVQLLVGAADLETWEIHYSPESVQYKEGINDSGRTRVERNATLAANLRSHDIRVQQDIVPNTAHAGMSVVPYVQDFLLGLQPEMQD
ncbi:pimeloyl-ACP methyl ester carboxylesterase [Pseudomonas sp. JUb42]|jgi:pimeloyl-ACP methyl ester carboxylesterase|uniref:alpha/beta fold hydrolase n=1 Tax=Pseudomonas sp. JUb42 TaxID=2940611 RepID=UPI002168A3EF|nr:alpha/beta hydrolase [Pseudomonas sp. JUb42]MCS3471606.1 pimeloyl-ACP methyl ester carboxylesterase [Pseudomonas sp. JUb42]